MMVAIRDLGFRLRVEEESILGTIAAVLLLLMVFVMRRVGIRSMVVAFCGLVEIAFFVSRLGFCA